MSYRTFKHLLGETSLERKCRFIFGGGILALVTLSFYWYGQKTESLVIGKQTETARVRVDQIVPYLHIKDFFKNSPMSSLVAELAGEKTKLNQQPRFEAFILKPHPQEGDDQPRDDFEAAALAKFRDIVAKARPAPNGERPILDEARIVPGKREYQYAQALFFKPSCIDCHTTRLGSENKKVFTAAGDLAGVVVVKLPMEQTQKDIHRNRAILISTALVTAILAMVASYVIVRYVIVKPVKHLRDVSDAIAAGKLNIRAQIQTGDEFEELSHAFNRMLHNLVSMQQELREVNGDLDKKVDELAQANMALFEMNRLKSDFLATMSHELRTPLNSIIGFSEVLASNEGLNDRQKRYAANIQTSGKMLLGMINDILDLAKIESGKMEVRIEDFSIRDVCEGLASLARPIADRKNIDLECRLDEAIPLMHQDSGKLRQVLYNLLSNAIKFTPEGGRVVLSARAEGRYLVLSVSDTGIGIAEEDLDRIFEKFRQAAGSGSPGSVLTREHQGTGLGLSIVRELAKLLGGDVTLESRIGQGSTFTVRVPMQLAESRRFEVNLSDERIDLSKARRVEPRIPSTSRPVLAGSEALAFRRGLAEPTGGESR